MTTLHEGRQEPEQPVRRPRLLTIIQSADYLGVTVHMLRLLIRRQELPIIPLGGRYRIDPADLEALISSRKRFYAPRPEKARPGLAARFRRKRSPRTAAPAASGAPGSQAAPEGEAPKV